MDILTEIEKCLEDGKPIRREKVSELCAAFRTQIAQTNANSIAPAIPESQPWSAESAPAASPFRGANTIQQCLQNLVVLADIYIGKINHNAILDVYAMEAERKLQEAITLAKYHL